MKEVYSIIKNREKLQVKEPETHAKYKSLSAD